ncbi:hypothetical protein CVU75_02000 [Candidatus Dependentiae bacterium HGW-Dependentiae-1]|nr:MAG: hypothetical protein CVU75_02000 [Candidatus Dependentiae bacterium HGW-Dependentiae-1]
MLHTTPRTASVLTLLLCILPAHAESWQTPNNKLRYDEVCFLTAHNAFTYRPKWIYAQQDWNLKTQLEKGIRGFMLDVHADGSTLKLCHGDKNKACNFPYSFQKIGNFDTLKDALSIMKKFLDSNKQEVVTLILEDYVDKRELLVKTIESISGLPALILNLSSWNTTSNGNRWPTLEWMQKNNKRLVIFTDKSETKYTPHTWHWVIESGYSSWDMDKVCTERSSSKRYASKPRGLYLLNWFGTTSTEITSAIYNTESKIMSLIKKGMQKGLANKRFPNFIALDFVNIGGGMNVVNDINKAATPQA